MNKTKAKEEWICRFAGAAGGLLLMLPNLYPILAPLQILALVPILYLGVSSRAGHSFLLTAGMYMGLAYTLPQMVALKLPAVMTIILIIHLTILMTILAWGCAQLLQRSALAGAFAVGAFLVVLDWANFTLVPFWGTAQSLVRPWSRYPALIAFVSFTGITGIIFVLGTLQALLVGVIVCSKKRFRLLATMAVVFLVFGTANALARFRQPTAKLKVAAVGWTSDDTTECGEIYSAKGFDKLFSGPVMQAAGQGAKLIVFPEMAFYLTEYSRGEWLEKFGQVARCNKVFLVIGYFNAQQSENQLLFINPQGTLVSEYTKTYLTVFEKNYRKGHGQLRTVDIEGVRLGAMICQDDNFTHLSREYGRKQAALVAVPTLDWFQVKDAHLQNSIYRSIESRYAIVRAALNGISAIVSPMGEVLAGRDHFKEGPGIIMAEVALYSGRTIFSIVGHWPVLPSFMVLIGSIDWNLLRHWYKTKRKRG